MPQRRQTKSTTLPVIGGLFRGVIVSDPDGHQEVLPFSSGGIQVLTSGGVFADSQVAWGRITGTLSNQTDLQGELDAKQDLLQFDAQLEAYVVPI